MLGWRTQPGLLYYKKQRGQGIPPLVYNIIMDASSINHRPLECLIAHQTKITLTSGIKAGAGRSSFIEASFTQYMVPQTGGQPGVKWWNLYNVWHQIKKLFLFCEQNLYCAHVLGLFFTQRKPARSMRSEQWRCWGRCDFFWNVTYCRVATSQLSKMSPTLKVAVSTAP